MGSKRRWLTPALLVALLVAPFVWRLSVGKASAAGPAVEAPPPPLGETCDQSCTALASCGHEAAAILGLAPAPDPDEWKSLDVPATRAACVAPCVVEAESNPAFAKNLAACSECVRSYDCRDVRACLATCFPDPAILGGR